MVFPSPLNPHPPVHHLPIHCLPIHDPTCPQPPCLPVHGLPIRHPPVHSPPVHRLPIHSFPACPSTTYLSTAHPSMAPPSTTRPSMAPLSTVSCSAPLTAAGFLHEIHVSPRPAVFWEVPHTVPILPLALPPVRPLSSSDAEQRLGGSVEPEVGHRSRVQGDREKVHSLATPALTALPAPQAASPRHP